MASPEDVVNQVINSATSLASSQTTAADIAADKAVTASQGYSFVTPPDLTYTITAKEPTVPAADENSIFTFEGQLDKLIQLLTDKLGEFFTLYYPILNDAYDEATAWLVNTITNGGTGINPAIEAQIWQRGRDRIIAEGARADSQTLIEFSQRGFSLPSGVMAARLQLNRTTQAKSLQELSRDVAIKQAEIEIENLRFAVDLAIKTRIQALGAAADYLRAIMLAPDAAFRVATVNQDAKARLISATADLYRARLQRDEIAMRIPVTTAEITARLGQGNMQGFYQGIDSRVRAAVGAAGVYGAVAQAAISSLTAIGSTTVSTSGD